MKIGIIGLGFVGLTLGSVLGFKGIPTIGVEIDKEKFLKISSGKLPFYEPKLEKILKKALKKNLTLSTEISSVISTCNMIFVTVGTPQKGDGSIDLSIIKSVSKKIGMLLAKTSNKPIIIIKSTITPQSTIKTIKPLIENYSGKKAGKDFEIITNPEFLREGKAVEDTLNPHAIIFGGKNNKFLKMLEKFYSKLYPGVPIIKTNHQTAEMIKYANNSFLATKISFINQIAKICESIPGTNVDDIANAIGLDSRIGRFFLNAGPGYGGSCLPKDIKAIINFSSRVGINPVLFNAVEKINDDQLNSVFTILKEVFGQIKGKAITVLGVSFKPETDDIRESVSIKLIKTLLKQKANVIIHDPKAIKNAKDIFQNKISYARTFSEALKGSECVILMTQWKQYDNLTQKQLNLMKKRTVIDCRRILLKKKLDMNYFAIGLGK